MGDVGDAEAGLALDSIMMPYRPLNQLGPMLKAKRLEMGLTQSEIVARMDGYFALGHLSKIELGRVKEPTLRAATELSKAYEVSLEQMAEWVKQPLV